MERSASAALPPPDNWPAFYWLARHVLLLFSKLYFRVEVLGAENLPKSGGILLASNHASNIDPALLGGVLPRVSHFLAKEELFAVPVLGTMLHALNSHPIRRTGMDRAALRKCVEALKAGYPLVVFPEGTRTRDGQLQEAKPGLTLIARQARVPVLPLYIDGTFRAMPRKTAFPRPVKLRVILGKPMEVAGEEDAAKVMAAIGELRRQLEMRR